MIPAFLPFIFNILSLSDFTTINEARWESVDTSYASYSIAACASALQRSSNFERRAYVDTASLTIVKDSSGWRSSADTVPLRTRKIAQKCSRNVLIDTMNTAELLSVVRVMLTAGDDSLAFRAAMRRWEAASDSSFEYRLYVVQLLVATFMDYRFFRPSLVEHMLDLMIERDRQEVLQERMKFHSQAGLFYSNLLLDSLAEKHLTKALEYSDILKEDFRSQNAYLIGWTSVHLVQMAIDRGDSIDAVLKIFSVAEKIPSLASSLSNLKNRIKVLGSSAPPIEYSGSVALDRKGKWPVDGTHTIVLNGVDPVGLVIAERMRMFAECSLYNKSETHCRSYSRKKGEVAQDTLDFLLLGSTDGEYRGAVLTREEEVTLRMSDMVERFGYRGGFLYNESVYDTIPDGRLRRREGMLNPLYSPFTLVDGNGKIVYVSLFGVDNRSELRAQRGISRVLQSKRKSQ